MADVPVLVCTSGELAGKRIPVPEGGLGIGRSPENTVVIHDEGVSRYHGRLLFDNGSLWLQDAGSRNGVFVNGARVTGHKALKVGDSITIAQHTFELRWHDEHHDEHDEHEHHEHRAAKASTKPTGKTIPPKSMPPTSQKPMPPKSMPPQSMTTKSIPPAPAESTEPAPRRRWFWPFS